MKQCIPVLVEEKTESRKVFSAFLQSYRHLLSGILRHWHTIDPSGEQFHLVYERFVALCDLYQRCSIYERGSEQAKSSEMLFRQHTLQLFKLYQFDSTLINNFILAELYDLRKINETFALLDLLKGSQEEIALFRNLQKIGPSLKKKYEDLSRNAMEIEYSRMKNYMYSMKLIAIAGELGCGSIYDLTNKNAPNNLQRYNEAMAWSLRKGFYQKLKVDLPESTLGIDEKYMLDIIAAHESLKGDDRHILIIMLKAIVHQLDLNSILVCEKFNDAKLFSTKENSILKKLQAHNLEVKSKFESSSLNWALWQAGIEPLKSNNIAVSLWKRDVAHDLFQGEFCHSCISLVKSNAKANLQYLSDYNFSMLEINHDDITVGHVTIWVARAEHDELSLVMNSIQVHRDFEKYGVEIRGLVFDYAVQLKEKIGLMHVFLGQGYNAVPLQILRELDDLTDELHDKSARKKYLSHNRAPIDDDELQIEALSSPFAGEMYSDLYWDGWVSAENQRSVECCAWNIYLFSKQAYHVEITGQHVSALSSYDCWIVKTLDFDGIKVCQRNSNKLIIITENYWKNNNDKCFDKVFSRIKHASDEVFFIDPSLIPLNEAASKVGLNYTL